MHKILSVGGVLAVAMLLGAGCTMLPQDNDDVSTPIDNSMMEETQENGNTNTMEDTMESEDTVMAKETQTTEVVEVEGYGSAGSSGTIPELEYYSIGDQNVPAISTQGWAAKDNATYGYKFVYPVEYNCQKEPGSLDCEIDDCKEPPTEIDRPDMVVRNRMICSNTCEIQEGMQSCSPAQVQIITYEKKQPADMKKFCDHFANAYNNACLFNKLTSVNEYESRYTYLTKSDQSGETRINDFYYIVPENSEFMYQIINSNDITKPAERATIETLIKGITYKK